MSGCRLAEILGGEWCELRGERFLVIDRKYPPGSSSRPRGGCRHAAARGRVWSAAPSPQQSGDERRDRGGCCFVDLETTGLAGGAGTYAFLVGCAWYQDGGLRIRQFFLSNFAAERVLLEAVADIARARPAPS